MRCFKNLQLKYILLCFSNENCLCQMISADWESASDAVYLGFLVYVLMEQSHSILLKTPNLIWTRPQILVNTKKAW